VVNSWVTTFGESSGGTGDLSFTSGTSVSLGSTSRTFHVLNTTSFANAFSTTSGSIIKTGAGTLVLTGGSTYQGATIINAGTLQLGSGGTTGSLSTVSAITNNGTLVFNRNNAMTQGTAFGTVITGTGNIVQAGTGTLTLSGVNTYTGSTTVSAGNITISNASALGSTAAGTTVANGAALQIQGDIAVGAEALNLTGSGFSNAGALRNLSGTNSLGGAITLSGATTIGADSGTLTLSGGISGTQNLTLVGAGNTTLSGAISTSTGTLTKNGSGTATLSAANTYSGSTTINSGTLVAAAANALGGTSQIVVNTGGSFLVTTDDSVNNSAGVTLAGGSLAFSGNRNETFGALTLSANSTLDFGTESVVAIFSSLAMNGYSLSVYNWTGTTLWNGGTGNNTDQFYVNSTMGDSDLARISFYSTSFQNSFLGDGYQIMSGGFANQIIPVPEPETYATAALLLLSGVIWSWKQRQRALRKTG
jgi:autotransporter-associated beta strand protein